MSPNGGYPVPFRLVSPEIEVAIRAAEAAADVLLKHFRGPLAVRGGKSPDLVTEADLESEALVKRIIRDAFPDHSILAEEAGLSESGGDFLWIVDPLDGTTNFIHGLDQFAVSIAHYQAGKCQSGVVHRPVTGDWFVAIQGGGAWRNGVRATVSPADELNRALLGVGFYYDRGEMMRATLDTMRVFFEEGIRGFRRMGAASLDLCMVGCGQLAGYFEFELSPWDFAAGQLFVNEAGGRVSDCAGQPLLTRRSGVVASNSRLHDELLRLIQPAWSELHSATPLSEFRA